MPKYEIVYQVKDGRGFPGDLGTVKTEAIGQQNEWLQVAVANATNNRPSDIKIHKSREVK